MGEIRELIYHDTVLVAEAYGGRAAGIAGLFHLGQESAVSATAPRLDGHEQPGLTASQIQRLIGALHGASAGHLNHWM